MKYIIYGNGGSGNHGCEAIVRGTQQLLGGTIRLHTVAPEQDMQYGLGQITSVVPATTELKHNSQFYYAYAKMKLTGSFTDMDGLSYLPEIRKAKGQVDFALSAGGDNYCYQGAEIYDYLNRAYHKNGFKTVLWGCSVEPTVVIKERKAKNWRLYDLIVARESITFNAIRAVNKETILAPDPAFFMLKKHCQLENRFTTNTLIGVNASPHILKCANDEKIAYENYKYLIHYILHNTDATIALIPHVVWATNDDRKVLGSLYEDFGRDPRLILVGDHTAPELKYIISKCSFFIGARTHATIAAYSSCVPTLVVGYSVKARGIARDLFGTEEDYVVSVQQLMEKEELTQAFSRLYEQRVAVRAHLENLLPDYLSRGDVARKALEDIVST